MDEDQGRGPRTAATVRILVAEDHDAVRLGVRQLLSVRAGWLVVGEARDGREALELARSERPDVAVLDLTLPELSGIEVIRRIRTELPGTEVCVFSMHEDEGYVVDAVAAGARAYVLKSEPGARLLDAIDALSRKEPYFSPRMVRLVLEALVHATALALPRRPVSS
jgi:DNA-binding NarL/FixJ family response regulator